MKANPIRRLICIMVIYAALGLAIAFVTGLLEPAAARAERSPAPPADITKSFPPSVAASKDALALPEGVNNLIIRMAGNDSPASICLRHGDEILFSVDQMVASKERVQSGANAYLEVPPEGLDLVLAVKGAPGTTISLELNAKTIPLFPIDESGELLEVISIECQK